MSLVFAKLPSLTSHYTCPHVFLGSSGLWQFFSLSLLLLNWNTLRSRVFCKISLRWDMSVVYLMIELGLRIIYRDILPFLLYHIKDRYYHMIYQSWYGSDHLAKVVFVSCLRSKLIHCCYFYYYFYFYIKNFILYFVEESYYVYSTRKSGRLC